MASPLEAWRDTLKELGVMGLVRPEAAEAPAIQVLPATDRKPEPLTPRLEARGPAPAPKPAALPAKPVDQPYAPPSDPAGCPPDATVQGAASLADLEAAIQGCLK